MKKDIVVGIDLGGTHVRAGAFDAAGDLLAMRETPTEAQRGAQAGLQRIEQLVEQVWRESGAESLAGIGIGCTGPVDVGLGVINNPYTLPGWENVPIVSRLQERFGVPVTLENDADVAALGEYWRGAGQSIRRLYAVTVGTGVGTALILDGEIYRGLNNAHPDGGHIVIDPVGPPCYCGANGCWESLCAGPAIARMAQQADLSGSILLAMADGVPERIDARLVAEAARRGDLLASAVIRRAAYYFSLGIVNVITLFVPEMIVLSGGVMRSADLFLPVLREVIARHSVMVPATEVRIEPAQLGAYAGLYGAAYTIWSKRSPYESG